MIFGHNTNLKQGNYTFHIQTEDRGEKHALIETVVYFQGRVLHRRANNYFDLLPLDESRSKALKLRLDEQHRNLIEEIRSGVLQLTIPLAAVSKQAAMPEQAKSRASAGRRNLSLELTNVRSWLSGKRAKLLVTVHEQNGQPVANASLKVEIEGSDGGAPIQGQTNAQGQALIEFDMPRIVSPEAFMVIFAEDYSGSGFLRFALRAKPRVA